jgi:hypothetical protein
LKLKGAHSLKILIKHIDDISLILGTFFLTFGGFLIWQPVGFIILGIAFIAYSFIFARTIKGGGS